MTGDLDSMLLDRLRGVELDAAALRGALSSTDASTVIPGLTNEALIKLICNP